MELTFYFFEIDRGITTTHTNRNITKIEEWYLGALFSHLVGDKKNIFTIIA